MNIKNERKNNDALVREYKGYKEAKNKIDGLKK